MLVAGAGPASNLIMASGLFLILLVIKVSSPSGELLVNQAAMQSSDTPKRVVLDCDGSEDEREPFLERQAGRAAKRALDSGRAVALDPMNARDRRSLHVAVRDIDDVVTMSVGTGRYRQVVIVPKGADEYEEALRLSEEAQSRD